MSERGEVVAIWLKRFKRGPMDPVESARAVAGRGLAGNANQGGRRQVTIIDEAAWRRAGEAVGAEVDPRVRRANVMLRGVDLAKTRGRILRIGSCTLRVHTETTPCERMEEAHPGLQAALKPDWRGGISCVVLEDGEIRIGDEAAFLD